MSIVKQSHFANTLHSLVDELPFVPALKVALRDRNMQKQDEELQRFIETTIGKYLDVGNLEAVAVYIQQQAHQPWLAEGLTRGFKDLLDSVDELSRQCLMVLVADYMKRTTVPDRIYKQFATFFTEVDAPLLKVALSIADTAESIGGTFSGFGASNRRPRTYHVFCLQKPEAILPDGISEEDFFACYAALLRNGFASSFTGATVSGIESEREELDKFAHVAFRAQIEHHGSLWKRLRGYLAPVRQA